MLSSFDKFIILNIIYSAPKQKFVWQLKKQEGGRVVIIKEIKSITKLEGVYGRNIRTDRWSINFTDGSNMVVKGAIPFEIVGSIGMMVQIFKYKKFKTVLFGWPKNKGSIALLVCYEWSTMFGFNNCRKVWKENYWLKPGGRVLDKRKPGKPVALNVTNKGDILSP